MNDNLKNRMYKHNDYRRVMQVRAAEPIDENESDKMFIEGTAVVFDTPTVLFKIGGNEYKEVIAKGAFDETDLSPAFLKYNHSDHIMAMARYKNNTLKIDIQDDCVKVRAELANTTSGRDLHELVKRGDIDKMSFAFTIREESYDQETRTWTVRKIGKLYDVAAVTIPAYEDTDLYARRFGDVESRQKQVEALELVRKRIKIKLDINKK